MSALPATPSPRERFARDALAGLSAPHKGVPTMWRYDAHGRRLAAQAVTAEAAHPAHCERRLVMGAASEIAQLAGAAPSVAELGFGIPSALYALWPALASPTALPPLEIAGFAHWWLPAATRPLLLCGGSVLAWFAPEAVLTLLLRARQLAGPGALLLVGQHATRDRGVQQALHDDPAGRAAALDLHLVERLRGELGADLDPADFRHELRFDAADGHAETHLVARRALQGRLRGRTLRFGAGESVHTSSVRAYGPLRLQALASRAGWVQRCLWADRDAHVALHLFEARTS